MNKGHQSLIKEWFHEGEGKKKEIEEESLRWNDRTLCQGESSLALETTWIPGETSWTTMGSPLGRFEK